VHALPDALLVVTSPQQRSAVCNLLRKNIFFMDKVRLTAAHETLGQMTLYGPHSADIVSRLTGLDGQDVAALALHSVAEARVQAATVWVARTYPLGGAGFCLYAPPEVLPSLWEQARQAGAQPLGQAAYDILRVEAGYAAYGRELSLEYIPLETGLWDAVSFRKGCYVGQEIIARMESRGRIAKHLRGLRLSAAVKTPQPLQMDGKQVGTLTSLVNSPRFGTIGLAYVRAAHSEPGTPIGIADREVTGQVVLLPFAEEAEEKDT
jgi:aminomethyltransferase